MKKLIYVFPLVLLLSACSVPSVENLMENPEKMMKISQECMVMMSQGKDTNTEKCNNAMEAQKRMMNNVQQGIMNQLGN